MHFSTSPTHQHLRLPSLRELGLLPCPTPEAPQRQSRWKANTHQLNVLNQVFINNPFPSKDTRLLLSTSLKMHPRTLQIWFQNRRQTLKANKSRAPHSESPQELNPSHIKGASRMASVHIPYHDMASPTRNTSRTLHA
ncbi:hypothetical protein DSO57_1033088 [Entomophthora muscae]|uniref:Uncharacterized protein n=1 Tax=Entomophthora muscae TaxID=34485 RepID=A0ACC2REY9_9FUNG|nr:hypothetical protein DSO57_1033088 [Entomophthora muscae]